MSKDLKDLIDSVEKETQSRAELEKSLHSLKEENDRLEFTVQEQKLLIENLRSQMKDEEIEQARLPSELDVLKDLITSQRKELEEKDIIIDTLNDKIYKLSSEEDRNGDYNIKENLNEEYINAQKLIVQLTDENEEFKNQIMQLQTQLEEIQSKENQDGEWLDEETQIKENEELINIKRLNFHLMEENGLMRLQVESLKSKIQERLDDVISEELNEVNEKNAFLMSEIKSVKAKFQEYIDLSLEESELAKEKIAMLTLELEENKEQMNDLRNHMGKPREPSIISTEEALEFTKMREELDDLKEKLLKSQIDNQALNVIVNDLKQKISAKKIEEIEIGQNIPKKLSLSIFYRMFNLLDDHKKLKVINSLIQDLHSVDNETKRNAIRILSVIKNNSIFSAFLEMLDDKDWLVRYSIIKALSNFDKKREELKPILKKLTKDNDVDVRELAVRILNDISQ